MRLPVIASILLLGPVGTLAASNKVSKDASCGGTKGYTCLNSQWGNCCSKYGWCGSTSAYCDTGCNSAFGTCSKIKPAPSPSSQPVSTNARCGPSFGGKTCQGSGFGDCCSLYSWCGSTSDYCGATNCQKGFGKCNTESLSSGPIPSTLVTSTRGSGSSSIASSSVKLSSSASSALLSSLKSSSSVLPSSPSSAVESLTSSAPLSSSTGLLQSSSASVSLSSSVDSFSSPSIVKSFSSSIAQSSSSLVDKSVSSTAVPSVSSTVIPSASSTAALSVSSTAALSVSSMAALSSSSAVDLSVSSTVVPSSSSAVDLSSSSSGIATSSSVQATPVLSSFGIVSSSSIEAISSSFSSEVVSTSVLSSAAASSSSISIVSPAQTTQPSSSSIVPSSSFSSEVVSASALSSAAALSSSISIVSPTQTTQPSSSSIVPSSSSVSLPPLPTCGVLGTINKDSVYRSGLSKIQSACRQECLDYKDGAGWKCQIYSMPTLYAGCTMLLSNPAHPELNGAFIKEDTGNERYWDVTCEGVSTLPSTYPSPVPARGCDAPGVPGRAQLDVPSDYGFSKTPGDCHQECQNYSINGWRCRAYGVSPSPPLCLLTLGKPAPTLDAALKRDSSSTIMWWETTCAGAAPAWPSIPSTNPYPVSQCGMRGMPVPWGTPGFKYIISRTNNRLDCKRNCEKYNLNDDSCKVYGVSPTNMECYLTIASKAPAYDDVFYPKTSGSLWWFQEGCSEPDTWFREKGLLKG